ncbi:MAG: hypothetical protein CMJ26_08650 [Phycisphaerae bacterium]|nr:hypothetical protein [Phycisphaerae bacterium]
MRRVAIILCILMLMPIVGASSAESTVEVNIERRLANHDLGINGGALSPNGKSVLIYGAEGYAHLISAKDADSESGDVRLENETIHNLNSASWHPGGKSAIIVGDSGTVLRYNSTTYGLGEAEGSSSMSGNDITAVQFTPGSSVAYLGTESGHIWKYYADTFTILDNSATSRVTDIACLKNDNICVFTTLNDGLAVVDQGDTITWIANSKGYTWVGVSCEDPQMNSCSAFASGKKAASVNIDVIDSTKTSVGGIIVLGQLEGDTIGDNPATDSSTLLAMAPLGLVRWNQYEEEAYLMFSNDDASEEDVLFAADRYAVAWENSKNSGFLITGQGRIISFEPASEDDSAGVPVILIALVAMCVPGVFLGLIYWNSPWLQRKYANLFGRSKKKSAAKAIQKQHRKKKGEQ